MEKMMYKFLDEYLGDEVVCIKTSNKKNYTYDLCSKKNKTIIISFTVSHLDGEMVIYKGNPLNKLLSDLFSTDDYDTMRFVRNWFGDKHNLNKVKDLIKFIHVYGN
jgi:hypothetical protein